MHVPYRLHVEHGGKEPAVLWGLNDKGSSGIARVVLFIIGIAMKDMNICIPVTGELEGSSRRVLETGKLAYWRPGRAFCAFFGSTPASQGDEIRAY